MSLAATTKEIFRTVVPLGMRMRLARWIGRTPWFPNRYWHSMELVRDLERSDVQAFHRFLWANHLAYAETYEVERRFGAEQVNETRKLLFDDVAAVLRAQGLDPATEVRSVFEVGCSMGYLLRHLETTVFPGAMELEGIDIDARAVRDGAAHLSSLGSRVRVACVDMSDLGKHIGDRRFDVFLASGVLIYLEDDSAAEVVATMLAHADRLVAITGLAHPSVDNRNLERSERRARDGAMIQNLDALVQRAGGTVVHRRWEGSRVVDGNTIYFVLAAPGSRVGARDEGNAQAHDISGPKLASEGLDSAPVADSSR